MGKRIARDGGIEEVRAAWEDFWTLKLEAFGWRVVLAAWLKDATQHRVRYPSYRSHFAVLLISFKNTTSPP